MAASDSFPRLERPSGAVVHMFHGGLWGGWQYQVTAQVRFDTLFCLMSSFLSLFGVVLVHVSTKFREFCQTPESFTFGYGGVPGSARLRDF